MRYIINGVLYLYYIVRLAQPRSLANASEKIEKTSSSRKTTPKKHNKYVKWWDRIQRYLGERVKMTSSIIAAGPCSR